MYSVTFAVSLLLTSFATATFAGENTSNPYKFSREISTQTDNEEALVAVELDDLIYAATNGDPTDLRIVDSNGHRVPFLIQNPQVTTPRTVRKSWTANRVHGVPLTDGELEITVRRDPRSPLPDGIAIHSPLRDFEHRIRVFTSRDGAAWTPHGEATTLFDYSQFIDARNVEVNFPETNATHFRFIVDEATQSQELRRLELTRKFKANIETNRREKVLVDRRPFRIDRIAFLWSEDQPKVTGNRTRNYRVDSYNIKEDDDVNETVIRVDVPNAPITSLKLQTQSTNFSRRVVVEALRSSTNRDVWTQVANHTVSKFDFHHLKESHLNVTFSEHRARSYRLRIQNRENPPLDITGVLASGNVYQVVFLASNNSTYQLVYASDERRPPDFDTSALRAIVGDGFQTSNSTLGQPTTLTATPPRHFKYFVNDPRIMIVAILVLVVVLGWTLYGAVQRLETATVNEHPN